MIITYATHAQFFSHYQSKKTTAAKQKLLKSSTFYKNFKSSQDTNLHILTDDDGALLAISKALLLCKNFASMQLNITNSNSLSKFLTHIQSTKCITQITIKHTDLSRDFKNITTTLGKITNLTKLTLYKTNLYKAFTLPQDLEQLSTHFSLKIIDISHNALSQHPKSSQLLQLFSESLGSTTFNYKEGNGLSPKIIINSSVAIKVQKIGEPLSPWNLTQKQQSKLKSIEKKYQDSVLAKNVALDADDSDAPIHKVQKVQNADDSNLLIFPEHFTDALDIHATQSLDAASLSIRTEEMQVIHRKQNTQQQISLHNQELDGDISDFEVLNTPSTPNEVISEQLRDDPIIENTKIATELIGDTEEFTMIKYSEAC